MASEMGQTWEMGGQDPFLSGFLTPPEPEVSSFQGLRLTGKILGCLLDAFVPWVPAFEGTMSKDTSTLFSIRAWGRGIPMLMEHCQLISFSGAASQEV